MSYRSLSATVLIVWIAIGTNQLDAECKAPATWFPHATTPEPDFGRPTSDCGFHQWAWQEFLWLTQPSGPGRIRLLDLPTAEALFSPGRAPAPLAAASMQSRLKKQSLRLMPRTAQSASPTSIADIRQAGSKGVLVDQQATPVYFASFVSPEYYEFVRTNQLYLKDKYLAAPDTMNFPKKAVELKSAWMVVPQGMTATNFFTTLATIPKLKCNSGGPSCTGGDVVVDASDTMEVTVALVGLHVVGVLEGHPEFVWSTFEHVKNAPNLPMGMATNSPNPVSNQDWTFYKKNTPAMSCNLSNSGSVSLNTATQKLSPVTNVFLQFKNGGGNNEDSTNIDDLNKSVHTQLDPTSVWQNYILGGGVWFADGNNLAPGLNGNTIQTNVVGSVQIANSTMETFTQDPGSAPNARSNCFSCHNTKREPSLGVPAKNLNLSHILMQGLINREQFSHLAQLSLSPKVMTRLANKGVQIEDIMALNSEKLFARPQADPPLKSYAEVQAFLNDFVSSNGIPINFSPHGAFWKDMTYAQFTTGNIPNVSDPATGMPLKVMVMKDADHSNIIMALRGTKGTIFDPDTGSIGQMPPSGPFMTSSDIQRIADWINNGAPK